MNKSECGKFQKIFIVLFSIITEFWDFETGESEIIEPTLPNAAYTDGMALFEVNAYFCNI